MLKHQKPLPNKLDDQATNELLERIHNGEEELIDELIKHNLRLVHHVVTKFSNLPYEPDDIFQIGSIGLIKAARRYDHSKKIKFATYAARCIENEILMEIRKLRRHDGLISLNQVRYEGNAGKEFTLEDMLEDLNAILPDERVAEQDDARIKFEIINEFLRNCDQISRDVWMGLLNGANNAEVSRKYNYHKTWVSKVRNRDIRDLNHMYQFYQETGRIFYFKSQIKTKAQ